MGELFEELSKDLARGMSRRQALWRFTAGIAAAVGALFAGRPVKAQGRGNNRCVKFCLEQELSNDEFDACVKFSASCPPGYCYMITNGNDGFCVPVERNDACVEFCREQGLMGREFGECVAQSAHCPPGYCAMMVNGNFARCVPAQLE